MNQIKQFNFTEAQVSKLMAMQDELNTYIHPAWKSQGFDWNLAIIDECMEIHGHLGWKWWKKDYKVGLTESNKKQAQLEVIDILHFVLSQTVEWNLTGNLINGEVDLGLATFEDTVDWMLQAACDPNGTADLHQWAVLAQAADLTEQEILETYTQKYVLNKFRQDHGYKDGSYVKEWQIGADIILEDNEVLSRIVAGIKAVGQDTTNEELLYNSLRVSYNSRLNQ